MPTFTLSMPDDTSSTERAVIGPPGQGFINVKAFGARGNGTTNDSTAVQAAHSYTTANGLVLFWPAGTYLIDGWSNSATTPVHWRGEPGTIILVQSTAGGIGLEGVATTLTLASNATRRTRTVVVTDAGGVAVGDILYLAKAENVENYRAESIKRDIARVLSKSSNTLTLDGDLMFNWTSGDTQTIQAYRPREVMMEGIEFRVTDRAGSPRAVTLTGVADCVGYQDCKFTTAYADAAADAPDLEMIQIAVNVNPTNCTYGRAGYTARYGAMRLQSRNCGLRNSRAYGLRHLTYPAYWARDGRWDNLVTENCTAGLDSHNAFEQHWNNCETFGDAELSNFRTAGGSATNIHLRTIDQTAAASETGLLVCPQLWVAEYSAINAESQFIGRGVRVDWLSGSGPTSNLLLSAQHGKLIDVEIESNVTSMAASISSGAVGAVTDCAIRSNSIDLTLAGTAAYIRSPTRLVNSTGRVEAVLNGSTYEVKPRLNGRFGPLLRGGVKCEGTVYSSAAAELAGVDKVIPVKIFDSPWPFGNSYAGRAVVGRLRLEVAGYSISSTRWDTKRYEWSWLHDFNGPGGDAETALRQIAAASGNDGNGLALAISNIAYGNPASGALRNDAFVSFDLTASWSISGVIQVHYELLLTELHA